MSRHDDRLWGERSEQASVDGPNNGFEIASLKGCGTRSTWEEGVSAEQNGRSFQPEADGSGGVARRADGVKPQSSDLQHRFVLQDVVITGEHRRVFGRHGHPVAGLPHGGYGLNVVPVAMGLQYRPDVQLPAQF